MIRLWMDLRRDGLEHKHYAVASHHGPEVIYVSVTATLIKDVEPQFAPIEVNRRAQVVDDQKGGNTVQHNESAVDPNIAYVQRLMQLALTAVRIDAIVGALH